MVRGHANGQQAPFSPRDLKKDPPSDPLPLWFSWFVRNE